jgi:hypothetical protein
LGLSWLVFPFGDSLKDFLEHGKHAFAVFGFALCPGRVAGDKSLRGESELGDKQAGLVALAG